MTKARRAVPRKLPPSIWAIVIVAAMCTAFAFGLGVIVLLARTGVIP